MCLSVSPETGLNRALSVTGHYCRLHYAQWPSANIFKGPVHGSPQLIVTSYIVIRNILHVQEAPTGCNHLLQCLGFTG